LPEGTAETTDIFEIMHTMRAMRRLKPDPVPDELIRKILLAGQAAANGGNTQRWRFLVLKNHPGKKVVQGYYKKLFDEVVGPRYRNSAPPPGSDQQKQLRQMAANQYLTDHYHEAPVWIVACLEGDNPGYSSGASIYPAVENMLLAARALGLGSTLTTRHIGYAKECDEAMGIPPNYHSYAILPIGYPMGRFGPVGRGPLSEIVYLDGWGKPLSRNLINPVSGRRQGRKGLGDGSTGRSSSRTHDSTDGLITVRLQPAKPLVRRGNAGARAQSRRRDPPSPFLIYY
jgi:nitroreductase